MDDYTEIVLVEDHPMPSVRVKLYLSREQALKELNDNYVLIHQDHSDGAVSNIIDRDLVAILDLGIIFDNNKEELIKDGVLDNDSMAIILSMITHESYHLARRWMEYIGEDDPGEEEMAYHVEAISKAMFYQLLDYFEKD